VLRRRDLRGELERLVEVLAVEQEEAAELLLGLGEGSLPASRKRYRIGKLLGMAEERRSSTLSQE
jgi:hypothetical protein